MSGGQTLVVFDLSLSSFMPKMMAGSFLSNILTKLL